MIRSSKALEGANKNRFAILLRTGGRGCPPAAADPVRKHEASEQAIFTLKPAARESTAGNNQKKTNNETPAAGEKAEAGATFCSGVAERALMNSTARRAAAGAEEVR